MPTIKPVVIASNIFNEIEQLPAWFENVKPLADAGIVIVDTGSTDGSIKYCQEQGARVVVDDIILREGYGAARNDLRKKSLDFFPDAHWCCYLDADERIWPHERHQFKFLKDYLIEAFDVIAFPRIDWKDDEETESAKDYKIFPDWQARMTRLHMPLFYVRRLHEQLQNFRAFYAKLTTPKINHHHRTAGQDKRDFIGKLCAKLHMEDKEWGHTYPEHHKELLYREKYLKEGL